MVVDIKCWLRLVSVNVVLEVIVHCNVRCDWNSEMATFSSPYQHTSSGRQTNVTNRQLC